jgi:ParB family chromosome partitioning protein
VFDAAGLQELADSIRTHGLAQPITVRRVAECVTCKKITATMPEDHCDTCLRASWNWVYQIVAGERRFRACQLLKLKFISAIVRELSDEQASAIMLAENTGRKDLDPVDEALAYRKRQKAYNWTAQQIAEKAGVPVERVNSRLKLCAVRPEILRLVRTGQFPVGHAQHLSELDNNRQMIAARPLIDGKRLNVREFRQIVDKLLAEQQQEALFDLPATTTKPPAVKPLSVPVSKKLPQFTGAVSTSAAMIRYIETLQEQGLKYEAEVVGTVLMGLVESNCARLPMIPA